jgi:FMN-dependent NADH-azoreductase
MAPSDRVLLVNASPRASDSHSLRIADAFLEEYQPASVDRLDVFSDLPPFGQQQVAAKMAVIAGSSPNERDWADVLATAGRLRAADTWIFAVPMWNGGIPWALKLFIDTVTQPGIAFAFSPETGYRGLLGGRRALVVYTSRVYAPGLDPGFGADHQSTYLSWWLRYCGLSDIHELRLQPTLPSDHLVHLERRVSADARRLGREMAGRTVSR